MALALILDTQNLNPGHIHYVNLGKPLKLSFIFLIYKMKMVMIIIKLHNSLYPTPLGPGVLRNSEILKCLEYHIPYITCSTWAAPHDPAHWHFYRKWTTIHIKHWILFCCCCYFKSTHCTNPGQIFQPNEFATNLKTNTFILQRFGTRLVRLKALSQAYAVLWQSKEPPEQGREGLERARMKCAPIPREIIKRL